MSLPAFLLSGLAAAGLYAPPDDPALAVSNPQPEPHPVLREQRYRIHRSFTLAGHRSHSSHASHRSSSGGGYSSPTPTPTVPSFPSAPSLGGRNTDSTPPSSILPSSPGISPKVERLKGNTKAFKIVVMKVQLALFALSYYSGAVDGVIAPETTAAISTYQRSHGLSVNGTLSDELLDALKVTVN